ncbi:MAG: hypothetical protein AB2L22_12970 [Syntrophales bacterium]
MAAYEGWKYLKTVNVYEDRCMRIIGAITQREVRYNDCGTCGNQVVLLSGSKFSICQGLLTEKSHTYTLAEWEGRLVSDLKEWGRRSQLNMTECIECIALAVCGGCPCRLIASNRYILEIDAQHCVFANHVAESFLREICLEHENSTIEYS